MTSTLALVINEVAMQAYPRVRGTPMQAMKWIAFAGFVCGSSIASAQGTSGAPVAVQPRDLADSTFAVRLVISGLVSEIQHGRISPRRRDAALAGSVETLAQLASRRPRPATFAPVPLWDFTVDGFTFEAVSRDELLVHARVSFRSDSVAADSLTFRFTRYGGEWRPENNQRLPIFLAQMRQRWSVKGTRPW